MLTVLYVFVIVVYILVVAIFLAVLIVAFSTGQRDQVRRVGELGRELEQLDARYKSAKEAELLNRELVTRDDQAVRDFYEYGGC